MTRRSVLQRLAIGAIGAVPVLAACQQEVDVPTPRIQTRGGDVRGSIVDGVHRFLGIPFAEAPFGNARFIPPVPRSSWQGVLEATEYGAICPQTGGITAGLPDEGEDCLNLNVWTPDPGARGLPVMVWAHGGGQVSGSGAAEIYDGTHFTKQGVVVVTNNRRLGAEGYLYLPEYFGDGIGPGNLGILDQIEALRWVQENIEAFGGDPNNVTLFGESGGGAATQAVVATPSSQGLVHRAIVQSGGHAAQRSESAARITAHAMQRLDIRRGDIDALRSTPWSALVDLYEDLESLDLGTPQTYLPVLSELMPVHPVDAPAAGIGTDIDYLIGSCRDEARLFDALIPGGLDDTAFARRAQRVLAAAGIDWATLRSAYQEAEPGLAHEDADVRLIGDLWFRVPSVRIAETHASRSSGRTYMYLFTWESQFLGAAHAMDLMVFGNGLPFGPLAGFASFDETEAMMRDAWVRFATTGDPSTPTHAWPSYSEGRATMSINETPAVLEDPYRRQRIALDGVISNDWQSLQI